MAEESLKPVFLRGMKTVLRPPLREDIPRFLKWMNDPRVRDFILTSTPTLEQNEEEWLEKLTGDRHNIVLVIEAGDRVIGTMGIHRIDWLNRVCTTGACIGETDHWGRGYGTDAKMAVLEYLFDTLGMHKVCSAVIAYNERSLQYSMRCGYRIEGTRRRHIFKRGRRWDLIELAVFRRDWIPLRRHWRITGRVPSRTSS